MINLYVNILEYKFCSKVQGPTSDTVLNSTHRRGHLARGHWLVGGPGQRVRRAACHAVDLLALLQRRHQPRPLDGVGRAVAQLTLVVVAPCEHLSCKLKAQSLL